MVRRAATGSSAPQGVRPSVARCASPAGASPAPVSADAPGSRPQATEGDLCVRAGRRKPVTRRESYGGEQVRGPQHEVKLAASTEEQSESRADHVTAKATSGARESELAADLGGVWSAACVHGVVRNTRDPSAQPQSRQGGSYKPKAKSSAAQRESEGLVVPMMVVTNNAAGGKGPCFGHARSEGKREGMAAKSGPNYPDARTCVVQVREPQRELCVWAEPTESPRTVVGKTARSDVRAEMAERDGSRAAQAPQRRPSVSRVPEIGMHGLNGGPAFSSWSFNLNARRGRIYQ